MGSKDEEPLLPELMPYFDSEERVLHHRFMVCPLLNAHSATHVNEIYCAKKAKAEQAWIDRDWHEYVFLHEKPYRLGALSRCLKANPTGESYWPLVSAIWIASECLHQDGALWRRIWSQEIPDRHLAMTEEERVCLAQMQDEIQVWRGTGNSNSKVIKGLSWTLDFDKANWFARRFQDPDKESFVASGLVRKADIFALLLGRNESEIVASQVLIERVWEVGGEAG